MIKRLIPKSEFSRNVLTLMTGTTIAQAIPIAISPILTRIYTPEDFGMFALYMSVASIISVVATGRYELAIMLPKKDEDAINIAALSLLISFFVSFISLLIVFIFNYQITSLLGNPEISSWLYFIPITVLLAGIYQSFNYWNNRKKQYKRLAVNRVLQSGVIAATNLGMGFAGFGSVGLISGVVSGRGLATIVLGKIIWNEDRNLLDRVSKLRMVALAKRHVKFPRYDVLASMSNISAHQVTHILFNSLFNSAVAGQYYLTQRIIGLPITFIASAISDVFREKASKDFLKLGNAKDIYKSTFKKLFILSVFPSTFLYFFGIELFIIIFGEEWKVAGEYAQILAPMLFIRFISSPLSFMLYIGGKQRLNLFVQGSLFFLMCLSFYIANSAKDVVIYISISFSAAYLFYLYISAKIAKVI